MAPSQKRKRLKRLAAQSVKHCLIAAERIITIQDYFVEFHPEWQPLFDGMIQNLFMEIEFIQKMSILAWGSFPTDLDKWLK